MALSAVVAREVAAGWDRRNLKVLVLLICFCGSVIVTAVSWQVELALRVGLASIVGLVAIIGGRVTPALTASYAGSDAGPAGICRSPIVERGAGLATASALGFWVAIPEASLTGLLSALAACCHAIRVAQWQGWRSRS